MKSVKKLVSGLAVAAFVITGVGSASASAATMGHSDVTGVVTENHIALPGADVTVLCNSKTLMDTTDAYGSYLVSFDSVDCPFGSTVKVTAQKDGKSGVSSGTVHGVTTKLNLAIVNVEVPEYGLIGAVTAGGAGLGLIVYKRRQQLQL
jgi:hypothetical protein